MPKEALTSYNVSDTYS